MTEIKASDVEAINEMPALEELPEIRLYSHSTIFYWWPVWLTGFALGIWTLVAGKAVKFDDNTGAVLTDSTPGLIFTTVLLFVIFVTNVRLRGIRSIVMLMAIAIIALLIAWAGLWDNIFATMPEVAIHLNAGFYFLFSTILLIIWASMFFIFDRMKSWRVRPGQMTEMKIIGSAERSFDTRGLLFEQRSEDIFRHNILGFGSGDLYLLTSGGRKEEIHIRNVLFVGSKVKAVQKLVAVQPDTLLKAKD